MTTDSPGTFRVLVLIALTVLTVLYVTGLVVVVIQPTDVAVTISRAGIITAAAGGPIGVLITLLQVQTMKVTLGDVQQKVNGHLASHVGHTDEQVHAIVDQALALTRTAGAWTVTTTMPPAPPPAEPPPAEADKPTG